MQERMRWLRENEPVFWSEKDGIWILSKYEDVSHVSKSHKIFCSGMGVRPGSPVRLGLIDEDEPRHTQLRRLVNKGFTPRMVKSLEGPFLQITADAIDAIAKGGACDFVDAIAVPLPLLLIAEMIGIRKEDRSRFHHWSDAMIAGDGHFDDPVIAGAATKAFVEYSQYITEIIEDRRKNPREDLVSILVGANEEGILGQAQAREGTEEFLSEMGIERDMKLANDELIMYMVLLLVAGNETTRNALSGGMQLLIENPGERQKLIDDPSLIPIACEEMVRLVSPVHSFMRTATQDTMIRDTKIEKGQQVLMLYPSANRDADVFEDPDTFKVERNPAHLGFGIGNHFCLGANLARMELRLAFGELLRRVPDMEYTAGGPVLRPSALVRTCAEMQVKFTPEG